MVAAAISRTKSLSLETFFSQTFIQIFCASLFIALCGRLELYLPFNPVPITAQTFAILLTGLCLGSRKAVLSVVALIAEGCIGLPVFIHGSSGVLHLLGPTGGYIVGFIPQAFLAGLAANATAQPKKFALLMGACTIQLLCGAFWLTQFVGLSAVFAKGILPFLPGEALKALVATRKN